MSEKMSRATINPICYKSPGTSFTTAQRNAKVSHGAFWYEVYGVLRCDQAWKYEGREIDDRYHGSASVIPTPRIDRILAR